MKKEIEKKVKVYSPVQNSLYKFKQLLRPGSPCRSCRRRPIGKNGENRLINWLVSDTPIHTVCFQIS